MCKFLKKLFGKDKPDPPAPPTPPTPDPVNPKLFKFYGVQKFLKFVSYFDAIRAVYLEADLDYIKSKSIDGVRIMVNFDWFNYHATNNDHKIMFDGAGNLNSNKVSAFKNILHKALDREMVVDVSFISHPLGVNEQALRAGIINLLTLIQGWSFPSLVFDPANEHHDISQATATQLAADIRNIFGPNRYYYGISVANNASPEQACNQQIRIEDCNMVRYHDPRVPGWADATVGYAQRLQKCAGDRPVYFDEPNRSGWSGNDYPASDFIAACGKAKAVGIAAWCLHTNAGFVLHDRSFQSQLTASEQEAITEIGKL